MNIIYLITARGGSKGVPRKNIRLLNGLPLIAYKIISALKCKYQGPVIVSTEDPEIAAVAKKYGALVPFVRPSELAVDTASSMDVVLHAMGWIEKNCTISYEYLCLLEPSSPFASYLDLNKAIDLLVDKRPDTLLAMKEVDVNTRFIHELDNKGGLSYFYDDIKDMNSIRRQDQPKQYTMNGCFYIAKWDYLKSNHLFHSANSLPYIMDDAYSLEIDTMDNYEYAKFLVEKGLVNMEYWS